MGNKRRGIGANLLSPGVKGLDHLRNVRLILVEIGVQIDISRTILIAIAVQLILDEIPCTLPILQRKRASHSRKCIESEGHAAIPRHRRSDFCAQIAIGLHSLAHILAPKHHEPRRGDSFSSNTAVRNKIVRSPIGRAAERRHTAGIDAGPRDCIFPDRMVERANHQRISALFIVNRRHIVAGSTGTRNCRFVANPHVIVVGNQQHLLIQAQQQLSPFPAGIGGINRCKIGGACLAPRVLQGDLNHNPRPVLKQRKRAIEP